MFIAIVISISVLLGGGASIASESSLPGEFLYSMKTNVNEPIKEAFTFGAKADALLDINLMQERLNERNKLEMSGKLTPSLDAEINTLIQSHYQEYLMEKESMLTSEESNSVNNFDVKISNMLSTAGINMSSEISAESNTNQTSDSSTSLDGELDVQIDSISNVGSDVGGIIDDGIDATSEQIKNLSNGIEAGIDASIDVANETMTNISTDIEAGVNATSESISEMTDNILQKDDDTDSEMEIKQESSIEGNMGNNNTKVDVSSSSNIDL